MDWYNLFCTIHFIVCENHDRCIGCRPGPCNKWCSNNFECGDSPAHQIGGIDCHGCACNNYI